MLNFNLTNFSFKRTFLVLLVNFLQFPGPINGIKTLHFNLNYTNYYFTKLFEFNFKQRPIFFYELILKGKF